jgi:hypothetical protein
VDRRGVGTHHNDLWFLEECFGIWSNNDTVTKQGQELQSPLRVRCGAGSRADSIFTRLNGVMPVSCLHKT